MAPARRSSSPRSPSSAWCSTRSPARPSSARWRTRASWTTGWSTRRRPAASSTASTATRSRPVLWRKVRQGLSAGRVQSVATRLVVERERERMAFRRRRLLGRDRHVRRRRRPTRADLRRAPARRSTASASPRAATSDDRAAARRRRRAPRRGRRPRALVAGLADSAFAVRGLETKPYTRRPAAPFTTSTLQQEAVRKLRMASAADDAHRAGPVRERLHHLHAYRLPVAEPQAIDAARRQAAELYGAEYVPDAPRVYASKAKGAQEAHEAIRPAGDHFRTPGAGGQRAVAATSSGSTS